MSHIVIIDCETTGLSTTSDSICQLAALHMRYDGGQLGPVRVLYNSLCNPGKPISQEARDVHGIGDEDVAMAVPADLAIMQLDAVIGSLRRTGTVIVAGHNVERYDIPLIDNVKRTQHIGQLPVMDTYTVVLRNWPEMPHKLEEFYNWYVAGEPVKAHDAAADCSMCCAIIRKYLGDRGIGPTALAAELSQPIVLERFPFGKHKGLLLADVPHTYLKWCAANFTDVHKDVAHTIMAALKIDTA